MTITRSLSLLVLAAAAAASLGARAQTVSVPPIQGVLNLSASASVEVDKDTMNLAFTVTRDGTDAAAVQSQLKQALDAALAEARRIAKPGQVEVRTGGFSLSPRYGQKGNITGWQGSTELLVEGRDMPAIAQLAGKVSTMSVGRVGYGISRELREKTESQAGAEAIESFKAKALANSRLFGYADYAVREVSVNANEPGPVYAAAPRMMAMAKAEDSALPVEAGKGLVTVTVSGSIQMR